MTTKQLTHTPCTILTHSPYKTLLSLLKNSQTRLYFTLAITSQVFLLSTLGVLLYHMPIEVFHQGFAGIGSYIISGAFGITLALILLDLSDKTLFKKKISIPFRFIAIFTFSALMAVLTADANFHLSLLAFCATAFGFTTLSLNSLHLFKSSLPTDIFENIFKPFTAIYVGLTLSMAVAYYLIMNQMGTTEGTAILYGLESLVVIAIYFMGQNYIKNLRKLPYVKD